jgi:hypothetical protein
VDDGTRGAMDDAMAVATADARREFVAAVVIAALVVVLLASTDGTVFPDAGLVDG